MPVDVPGPTPDSPEASSNAPRPRDAKATKAEIVAAAEALFLANGYAKTSMSEIAEQVGVAKSLIYHHFGNKEQLWEEVKASTLHGYHEAQQALFAGDNSVDVIRQSFQTYIGFLRGNPNLLRLNAWLELEGPAPANPHSDALAQAAVAMFEDLQAQGEIRSDVDPLHLMWAFVGTAEFWLASRKRIGRSIDMIRGNDESTNWDEEDERFFRTMFDVLLRGASGRSENDIPDSTR